MDQESTDWQAVICPFLGASKTGRGYACLASGADEMSLALSYASTYCLEARHRECSLFLGAAARAREVPAVGASGEVGPATIPMMGSAPAVWAAAIPQAGGPKRVDTPETASAGMRRAAPERRRLGKVGGAVAGVVLAVDVLACFLVVRSLVPRSAGGGPAAVSAPTHARGPAAHPPSTPNKRRPRVLGVQANAHTWVFPALAAGVNPHTMLVLFNPGKSAIDAHLKISAGGEVASPAVHILPGGTASVALPRSPHGPATGRVTLRSDRYVVPVRVSAG